MSLVLFDRQIWVLFCCCCLLGWPEFWDGASLYSPGCPGTSSVEQTGLNSEPHWPLLPGAGINVCSSARPAHLVDACLYVSVGVREATIYKRKGEPTGRKNGRSRVGHRCDQDIRQGQSVCKGPGEARGWMRGVLGTINKNKFCLIILLHLKLYAN